MAVSKEPSLMAKGTLNMTWVQWYSAVHGVSGNDARAELNARISLLPEPPLFTPSGKANPVWLCWIRVKTKCSSAAARSIHQRKAAGTYDPKGDLRKRIEHTCNKVDSVQRTARRESRVKVIYGKPWVVVSGQRIELDGRLGHGEKTLSQLELTNLGRQEINRINSMFE